MNCNQAQILMIDFIYGEITSVDAAVLHSHIVSCQDCRKELAQLRLAKKVAALQFTPAPANSPKIPEFKSSGRKIFRLAIPASIAASLIVGIFIASSLIGNFNTPDKPTPVATTDNTNDSEIDSHPNNLTTTSGIDKHTNVTTPPDNVDSLQTQRHPQSEVMISSFSQDILQRKIKQHLNNLYSKSTQEQTDAELALVKLGKPALQFLNAQLKSANPTQRIRIQRVIELINSDN